jgi:hypothetical protein
MSGLPDIGTFMPKSAIADLGGASRRMRFEWGAPGGYAVMVQR